MKKIFIAFVIILSGCTDDGNADSKQINLYFKNTSNGPVQIELYAEGDLRTSEIIASDQSGNAHTFYTRNSFNNFGFITDSLVIKYPNGSGYICSPSTDLCISSKPSPINSAEADFIKQEDRYYYILSQQDYIDALSLN